MAKKIDPKQNAEPNIEPGFEEKLCELQNLIAEIEAGKDGLNEAIQKFGDGKKLVSQLEKMLDGAKKVIDQESGKKTGEED